MQLLEWMFVYFIILFSFHVYNHMLKHLLCTSYFFGCVCWASPLKLSSSFCTYTFHTHLYQFKKYLYLKWPLKLWFFSHSTYKSFYFMFFSTKTTKQKPSFAFLAFNKQKRTKKGKMIIFHGFHLHAPVDFLYQNSRTVR